MSHDNPRHERVANQLQRELADLLRTQIKDPQLEWVSLTEIRVSKDLGVAKVYFTTLVGDANALQPVLQQYAGRLRGFLGKRMRIRHVPELRFEYDDLLEKGSQLSALIDSAIQEDKAHAQERGDERGDELNDTASDVVDPEPNDQD